VFRLRSANNIVIAPASTGRDKSNGTVVIKTAQAKRGVRSNNIPNTRRFPKALIKFTAPESTLLQLNVRKMAKSTDPSAWAIFLERGRLFTQY